MSYTPTPEDIEWVQSMLNMIVDGGIWGYPQTRTMWRISHSQKKITLIDGAISQEMYERVKACFNQAGYLVE